MNTYAIKGGTEGRNRLAVLSRAMQTYTLNFINTAGLKENDNVLDIGCGGGFVSFEIANIVGNKGKITAVDFDENIIALSEKEAKEKKISNIKFKVEDIFNFNEENTYHFIYSRFLLSHLKHSTIAISNMIKALKPGGTIAVEDTDFSGYFCYPDCKALDKYIKLYQNLLHKKGSDANIGIRLPEMFIDAGLKDVQFKIIQPAFMYGEAKSMTYLTMEKIKEALIEENMLSEKEIEQIVHELKEFTENPRTIISFPRIFQVWGKKS